MNNKTWNLAWLDKYFCTSRKKEMTGFIIGGTIVGSYLCSLIGRYIFPGPRKNEVMPCALYMSLAAKWRSRRNWIWQTCGQALRNTEQSNLIGHFPVPVLCPQLWKKCASGEGIHRDSVRQQKKIEGGKLMWWNWYLVGINWERVSTERKSSDSVIPSSNRTIFCT